MDANDNLWVPANQGDEIVVVVVAKKGDFNGVASDGSIHGLLFPASVEFSPDKSRLYITNLALYLPFAGVPAIAVDSGWTLQVKHNIAVIDFLRANNHAVGGAYAPPIGSTVGQQCSTRSRANRPAPAATASATFMALR